MTQYEEHSLGGNNKVVLHINESTDLVFRVDVLTPDSIKTEDIRHHPTGISKDEALKEFRQQIPNS